MEFHQKYSDYLTERDKRISNLDALKEQPKEYDEGSLEYETLGRIINAEKLALNDYVSETLNNLSLEMTRETATKLESARNDLLWEYKQSISRGDSAEILKELQDGIAEIDDKIAETNDKWLSGHEKIREEIIETADRAGDVFDAATKKIEKNIDRIDHKLNMLYALDETPKPIEEHAIYQEKNKAYQESIINNEAQIEKSHV